MIFSETFLSDDKDLPDRIEHGCDIIVDDAGELEQYYNYLVYHFSGVGHGLWARTYLDEMNHITLYGSISETDKRSIDPAAFSSEKGQEIVRYLQRRYSEVRLGIANPYIFPPSA